MDFDLRDSPSDEWLSPSEHPLFALDTPLDPTVGRIELAHQRDDFWVITNTWIQAGEVRREIVEMDLGLLSVRDEMPWFVETFNLDYQDPRDILEAYGGTEGAHAVFVHPDLDQPISDASHPIFDSNAVWPGSDSATQVETLSSADSGHPLVNLEAPVEQRDYVQIFKRPNEEQLFIHATIQDGELRDELVDPVDGLAPFVEEMEAYEAEHDLDYRNPGDILDVYNAGEETKALYIRPDRRESIQDPSALPSDVW